MKKLLAMLLFPMIANGEPGRLTQYLMNEPATLLDIGMVRLDNLTTAFEARVGLFWTSNGEREPFRAEVSSRYEPDDDKIYVSFLIMNSEATDPQMEEGCRMAMAQMAIWLNKSGPDLFLHIDYEDPSAPQDQYTAFQQLIELRCYVSSGRDTSQGRFWARRSLQDREITVGPWDVGN